MQLLTDKNFLKYVLKFAIIFSVLYFGTIWVIGLAAPGGQYSALVDKHLDYISWMRNFLLDGTKVLLSLFDIETYRTTDYRLRFPNGRGVILAYDCVGYGVMSFWIAFVFASGKKIGKKILWAIAGLSIIYLINISRVGFLLVAINRNWAMPLGLDHHTWFNILAYLAIFTMMYFFEKKIKSPENKDHNKTAALKSPYSL